MEAKGTPAAPRHPFRVFDDPVERLRRAHFDHQAFCAEPYTSETPAQRIMRAFELIEFAQQLRRSMR